jgi:hypothetical protein
MYLFICEPILHVTLNYILLMNIEKLGFVLVLQYVLKYVLFLIFWITASNGLTAPDYPFIFMNFHTWNLYTRIISYENIWRYVVA